MFDLIPRYVACSTGNHQLRRTGENLNSDALRAESPDHLVFIARVWLHSNFQIVYRRTKRKPLQYIHVTTPYTGHDVEVTFRSHYNAYDLFPNTTRLPFSLFNSGEMM